MRRSLSFLLLLSLACTSTRIQRPASIPQPGLEAQLLHEVFFGSANSAPAPIELNITNRAAVPIVVRRVEIDSPGMGQYTLQRTVRDFRETIAPGETKALTMFATAIAQTTRRPTEPLQLRVIFEFEYEKTRWREILLAR